MIVEHNSNFYWYYGLNAHYFKLFLIEKCWIQNASTRSFKKTFSLAQLNFPFQKMQQKNLFVSSTNFFYRRCQKVVRSNESDHQIFFTEYHNTVSGTSNNLPVKSLSYSEDTKFFFGNHWCFEDINCGWYISHFRGIKISLEWLLFTNTSFGSQLGFLI